MTRIEPRRSRVPGDGVSLACGRWPGAGPSWVGIHGLTATHMNFDGIAQKLSGRRALFAPDLRGRGDSDKPEGPYGIEVHARDVARAMEADGLGPSVLIGHSLGAYIATALAADFPRQVSGLVLIDGGYPPELPPGTALSALAEALLEPIVLRMKRTYASFEAHRESWRQLGLVRPEEWGPSVDAYLDYALGGKPPALGEKASEVATRLDFIDLTRTSAIQARLAKIRVPVLLLRASAGLTWGLPQVVPDLSVKQLASRLERFEERVIDQTNHYTIALSERGTSRVTEAILAFCARVEESAAPAVRSA